MEKRYIGFGVSIVSFEDGSMFTETDDGDTQILYCKEKIE